ncbi:MAG: cadherin-like domain-containing protein, partial [Pseudomonadota bacterium]
YTYTPNANFTGSDSFTYTITDADGDVSTATVTVNVAAVNDQPVAANDTIAVTEDTPASGSLALNDTPSGDGGNVWALGSAPANGTVTIDANGNYTYTPNANFTGSDSFTYTITDADGDVSTATVTVNVAAVNDQPDPGVTPQPPTIVLPEVPVVDDDPRPSTNPDTKDQPTVPEQVDSKVSFSPLYVLREVGELQVERNLVMSGAGAFMDSSLGAEVMGQVPDGMMLQGGMDGLRVRDYAFGEVMGFDPAVHVQHAVRHQPVTSEHGLFVQHAVRASQLEARVRDAAINAQTNSAALGVSTLFDAFALGSPGSQASDQSAPQAPVARTAAVSSASEAADKDKQQTGARVTSSDAASAQPAEKVLVPGQPRASAGFRSQLEKMARDRQVGARPMTRGVVKA